MLRSPVLAALALAFAMACSDPGPRPLPASDLGAVPDGPDANDGAPKDAGAAASDGGEPTTDAGPDMGSSDAGDGLLPGERVARADEPPRFPWLASSPSAMGHFSPARQASTFYAGPATRTATVQTRDFVEVTGQDIGTSPWHVLSAERYGRPGVRTVWGTGLRFAYKFVVDGERWAFADLFEINGRVSSIPWNLVALSDGRVIVPDTDGYDLGPANHPCRTDEAALLALTDRPEDPSSPIECVAARALDLATLRPLCGVGPAARRTHGSGSLLVVTFSGQLVTLVELTDASGTGTYAVAVANDLSRILACGRVADTQVSNEIAAEPVEDGRTALYLASERALLKVYFDPSPPRFTSAWSRDLPLRRRTGTTPTLMDTPGGDRLVVLVDGACAVSNVLNGLIVCDDDPSPSRLFAVRREDEVEDRSPVMQTALPTFIRTIENSPAVRRDMVVVANYSGYLPNGLRVPPGGQPPNGGAGSWGVSPDAESDFATGLAALRFVPERETFELVWAEPDVQVSGVPLIAAGGNMVYGSGAELADATTYVYGFLLEDEARGPGGTRILRQAVGRAPFRQVGRDIFGNNVIPIPEYTLEPGEFFDAGNNTVLNSDRSLILTGGRALVRVRE